MLTEIMNLHYLFFKIMHHLIGEGGVVLSTLGPLGVEVGASFL